MKAAIIVATIAAAATAGTSLSVQQGGAPSLAQLDTYTFEQYEKEFGKKYATEEERQKRKAIFETELKAVRAHNANPKASYKKGINHLSDKTDAEFKALNGDLVRDGLKQRPVFMATPGFQAPPELDYRKAFPAVLTAVKDQGHCGSCWAHSAIEAVESGYAHKTGKLYALSQQQLVSCAKNVNHCGGTGGCGGASAAIGIDYASQVGVGQEWVNGYKSYFGDVPECNFNASQNTVLIKPNGYVINPRNDQNAVMESLVKNGPLGVSVDASNWKAYQSGIFNGCDYANNITINHAVQLVGYGSENGQDYWIIRNSWSASWGENGFMRLAKESTPKCGWDNDWTTAGSGCPNTDPTTVWTCGQCGILYNTVYAKFD